MTDIPIILKPVQISVMKELILEAKFGDARYFCFAHVSIVV